MLSKSLQDSINEQMKHEFESAYLYLAMSAYCESKNLPGIATWLRIQWQEELSHAMKLFTYVNARGGRAVLKAIDQPPTDYDSPHAIFKTVLQHEQKVTGMINKLYETTIKEGDYATQVELQWFITEQVEEEKNAMDILHLLEMVGESGISLMMLDRQLGARAAGK
jgi:ferritin